MSENPTTEPEPLLTVPEVAACLGVTASSVRKYLADDAHPIPSLVIGKLRRLVRPAVLRQWAEDAGATLVRNPDEVAKPWPREAA